MKVFYYNGCSTCKKILKTLDENGFVYDKVDIKTCPPSYEELKHFMNDFDYEMKKFFNTSGKIYKDLNLKDQVKTMSQEEALELLSKNGMLIKRPIIVLDDDIIVGNDKNKIQALVEK